MVPLEIAICVLVLIRTESGHVMALPARIGIAKSEVLAFHSVFLAAFVAKKMDFQELFGEVPTGQKEDSRKCR